MRPRIQQSGKWNLLQRGIGNDDEACIARMLGNGRYEQSVQLGGKLLDIACGAVLYERVDEGLTGCRDFARISWNVPLVREIARRHENMEAIPQKRVFDEQRSFRQGSGERRERRRRRRR